LLALAVSGLAGCGPDYALFSVRIEFPTASTPSDRQTVEECRITVKDNESGRVVLQDVLLKSVEGPAGSQTLEAGCGGGRTPRIVGDFSYSTSRSGGSLNFTVNAYDNNRKIVHTGSKDADVAKFPPEVTVKIVLQAQK
jgi:2-polyprenyl-3-methyl-5-hydroxy-6-metoxy-1,4-benzoquinol methylase